MKNMIVTQYQMKRAERKKWLIATLVILLAFSALIGIFCAARPGTSAKAAENDPQIQLNQLFPKEAIFVKEIEVEVYSEHDGGYITVAYDNGYKATYNEALNIFNTLTKDVSFFTYKGQNFVYRGEINHEWGPYNHYKAYSFSVNSSEIRIFIPTSSTESMLYWGNNVDIKDLFEKDITPYLPEDPEAPEGYHFVGWYYDEAFTNPYKEGDVITADTNLYAKFEKDTYKVTYVVNGKQYVVSEVAYGDPINNTVPTGIDETNVFSGWFTDAECTQAFDFTQTASSDITLYSTIKLKTYDVKFFVNGELYATIQVPHGYTLVRLAKSSETGAATAAALLASFEFDENAEVNADTEITEDKDVQGKLSKKAEKWINTGAWFDKNWQWLVATAAALIVIVIGFVLVAVYKKRG